MENQPNYYAIIPAEVRYNSNLTFLERFLYSELTALSNVYGYCFASNDYFAKLYGKAPETISRALKKLQSEKHILIQYERKGAKVTNRKIYPLTQKQANDIFVNRTEKANDIFVNGETQKLLAAIDKKVKESNITILDIFNIITNIKPKDEKDDYKVEISEIVDYLNLVCKTAYKKTTKSTTEAINARLKDGYTVEDFKTVISKKYEEWHDSDMEKFLRPITLFGTKFENYLNAPYVANKGGQQPSGGRKPKMQDTNQMFAELYEKAANEEVSTLEDLFG